MQGCIYLKFTYFILREPSNDSFTIDFPNHFHDSSRHILHISQLFNYCWTTQTHRARIVSWGSRQWCACVCAVPCLCCDHPTRRSSLGRSLAAAMLMPIVAVVLIDHCCWHWCRLCCTRSYCCGYSCSYCCGYGCSYCCGYGCSYCCGNSCSYSFLWILFFACGWHALLHCVLKKFLLR